MILQSTLTIFIVIITEIIFLLIIKMINRIQVCSGEGFCDCGKCNCNVTSLGVPKSDVLVGGPACDCTISDDACKDGKY